ncbi:MAG: 4Fe-4S dicluster domain-containing protein [Chloroflexota bacterium]|jgi:formate dehydrogenase subunit beta
MNAHWLLETHGDPLGRLQEFVGVIWTEASLTGMLLPLNGDPDGNAAGSMTPTLVREQARLGEVNPFRPLMTENAAGRLPALMKEHPDDRLGVMLRPCEVRALVEMRKHNGFRPERLLLMSVDCLATYDVDEYGWRADRKRSGRLSDEALQFARQGGIVSYRYRLACQVCYSPEAKAADVNILVLGLPARRYLLVCARDEETAERLQLSAHTDGVAPADLLAQHERVVEKLEARRRQTRERLTAELGSLLPQDVDALVDRFEACGDCRRCLDACPICAVDYPRRDEDGRHLGEDIARWLISCAGCGMCAQACPQDQPLSLIFGHIRQKLLAETGYEPGRDYRDPLPVYAN